MWQIQLEVERTMETIDQYDGHPVGSWKNGSMLNGREAGAR